MSKKTRIKEKILVEKVAEYFKSKGYVVYKEVRIPTAPPRYIDLLALNGKVLAIEVKVSDWKTALKQANLYTLIADKSYVAIWEKKRKVVLENIELFKQFGIGIILVGDSFVDVVIDAQEKGILDHNLREQTLNYVEVNV